MQGFDNDKYARIFGEKIIKVQFAIGRSFKAFPYGYVN